MSPHFRTARFLSTRALLVDLSPALPRCSLPHNTASLRRRACHPSRRRLAPPRLHRRARPPPAGAIYPPPRTANLTPGLPPLPRKSLEKLDGENPSKSGGWGMGNGQSERDRAAQRRNNVYSVLAISQSRAQVGIGRVKATTRPRSIVRPENGGWNLSTGLQALFSIWDNINRKKLSRARKKT
jgi:hypothetical protein